MVEDVVVVAGAVDEVDGIVECGVAADVIGDDVVAEEYVIVTEECVTANVDVEIDAEIGGGIVLDDARTGDGGDHDGGVVLVVDVEYDVVSVLVADVVDDGAVVAAVHLLSRPFQPLRHFPAFHRSHPRT